MLLLSYFGTELFPLTNPLLAFTPSTTMDIDEIIEVLNDIKELDLGESITLKREAQDVYSWEKKAAPKTTRKKTPTLKKPLPSIKEGYKKVKKSMVSGDDDDAPSKHHSKRPSTKENKQHAAGKKSCNTYDLTSSSSSEEGSSSDDDVPSNRPHKNGKQHHGKRSCTVLDLDSESEEETVPDFSQRHECL